MKGLQEGVTGTLIEMRTVDADRYGFAYGVMQGDNGKFYVCTNRHFFRNCSYVLIGHRYRFNVVEFLYATDIDLIDKEAGRAEIQRQHEDRQRETDWTDEQVFERRQAGLSVHDADWRGLKCRCGHWKTGHFRGETHPCNFDDCGCHAFKLAEP